MTTPVQALPPAGLFRVHSSANYDPDTKAPICWAFIVLGPEEVIDQLAEAMPDYMKARWITGEEWALLREFMWADGLPALQGVRDELRFFGSVGEELLWALQPIPEQPGFEDCDSNFYVDPNEAMRHWLETTL